MKKEDEKIIEAAATALDNTWIHYYNNTHSGKEATKKTIEFYKKKLPDNSMTKDIINLQSNQDVKTWKRK